MTNLITEIDAFLYKHRRLKIAPVSIRYTCPYCGAIQYLEQQEESMDVYERDLEENDNRLDFECVFECGKCGGEIQGVYRLDVQNGVLTFLVTTVVLRKLDSENGYENYCLSAVVVELECNCGKRFYHSFPEVLIRFTPEELIKNEGEMSILHTTPCPGCGYTEEALVKTYPATQEVEVIL